MPWNDASPNPTDDPSGSFQYQRPLDVTADSERVPSGYALNFELDTGALISAGKLEPDGSDFRVFKDGIAVPTILHFTDAWTDANADFWLKLTNSIDAGATDTYTIMYGNPDAAHPNTDYNDVFTFYDGFETGDLSSWDDISGTGSIAASTTRAHSGSYSLEVSDEALVEERLSSHEDSARGSVQVWIPNGFAEDIGFVGFYDGSTVEVIFGINANRNPTIFNGAGNPIYSHADQLPTARWHELEVGFDSSADIVTEWLDNNQNGPSPFDTRPYDTVRFGNVLSDGATPAFWLDSWHYIPWRADAPTVTVGSEISTPN